MSGLGLTDPQMRALQAVHDLSGEDKGRCDMVSPRQVAEVLWPESPAWDRRPRRRDGRFGGLGGTMPMKAAKLLWALKTRGLLHLHSKYSLWALTDRGRSVLASNGEPLPLPNTPTPTTPVRRKKGQLT